MAFRAEIEDFGAFYDRTYQLAFRTAYGIVRDAGLAADVTQEAYVAAYAGRNKFRGESPSQAWLHRIVVNSALAALRRRRPVIHEIAVAEMGRPDESHASADRMALWDALDQLKPRSRAAVVLRYYHDYDYATIANILDTSTTNVGAMLSRALDQLRAELEPPFHALAAGAER
jgi:RNA polymerase sigma factor (sigma-70 family)